MASYKPLSEYDYNTVVTGERIQALADWQYTKGSTIPKENLVIYCCTYDIIECFAAITANADNKYILITHNSDVNIGQSLYDQMPKNILKWFGQNMNVYNDKVVGIPIGIANSCWPHSRMQDIIDVNLIAVKPKYDASLCIKIDTNPTIRNKWYNHCKNLPTIKIDNWPVPRNVFLEGIRDSYFTISPPGNGLDCHRNWESILCHRIPVVRDDIWLEHFRDLPFCILVDYYEISNGMFRAALTEFKLNTDRYSYDKLFMSYWTKRIENERKILI